jgi:hypothetical protein
MCLGRYRLLLALALVSACERQTPADETTPLVDGLHAPLVLTESALLEKPPAYSGNRFLSGWWPGRRSQSPDQLNVGDRVVLEAVFLDGRERRLATQLEIIEAEPGAMFGVRVAGIDLPPQPLVPDLEVPLPGGLPLGRLPIEFDLRGARIEIQAAGFGHAWQAGEVDLAEQAIVQGGYSAIDFPRRLEERTTLVGQFEPPAQPEPDQRFVVLIEADGSDPEIAFEWRPGGWRDQFGPRRLRLPLPTGFVRIRLLAQGLGPAGRWLRMGLSGGNAPPADEPMKLTTTAGRSGVAYVAVSDRYKLIQAPGLGLSNGAANSRDAEYVFDLGRDPAASRNLAGTRLVEIDWLRSRLESWIEKGETP